ncbi:Lipoprotein-releasing system ATP-binding protein LolD [Pontiella sulfatireligans]|uniref:Lipoprotein-releasing system ATP-binding protein LolD n=2 Tax=Pontiella sulfatireligans TaxID=2750658 RepID=A0A6C2UP74_9BACT|nr:Lipoprotein-releasing system ATP-binding protein LolD [Pontiella sulfatireligans]
MSAMLKISEISKQYEEQAPVLTGVDLEVRAGESVAVLGASGCGKSTLLNIIGALDWPDAGTLLFDGLDVLSMNEKQSARFRNEEVGFVFQLHHLLPQCTVLENVLVPALVASGASDAKNRAKDLLQRVGLADRLSHRPGQLSGGERQRVAVVRALINQPRLLLADEPTGALNREGADSLMELLLELNQEENLAMVMVTHSERLAKRLDRVLTLEAGMLK